MKDHELPIIQRTYDLILWYVPLLNWLPRDHKFGLGDRLISGLYDLLEQLILARYESEKLGRLQAINAKLNVLRYQTSRWRRSLLRGFFKQCTLDFLEPAKGLEPFTSGLRIRWVAIFPGVWLFAPVSSLAQNRNNAMSPEQLRKQPWVPPMFRPLERTMLDLDSPDHTPLRALVHEAFTPRIVEQMRLLSTEA